MSFFEEFKTFIARGNVLDMSVGVIVGGAFGKIVTSFTNDLLMPLLSPLMGHINFADLHFPLINDPSKYFSGDILDKQQALMNLSMEEVKAKGIPVIAYGNFLQNVVYFLIVAFCIFLLVKGINSIAAKTKKPEPEAAPTTKVCPECLSEIPIKAKRCKFCTAEQPKEEEKA